VAAGERHRRTFGYAEIHHLHCIAGGYEDVGYLDIAMDDASGVSRIHCHGYLRGNRQHLVDAKLPAVEDGLQRFTFEQLHRDKRTPILFADTVNGADVRMIESGGGARLALKSIHQSRRAEDAFDWKFQGNIAAQPGIGRPIHHAHGTGSKLCDNPVLRGPWRLGSGFLALRKLAGKDEAIAALG
jgi:hypothetical protein